MPEIIDPSNSADLDRVKKQQTIHDALLLSDGAEYRRGQLVLTNAMSKAVLEGLYTDNPDTETSEHPRQEETIHSPEQEEALTEELGQELKRLFDKKFYSRRTRHEDGRYIQDSEEQPPMVQIDFEKERCVLVFSVDGTAAPDNLRGHYVKVSSDGAHALVSKGLNYQTVDILAVDTDSSPYELLLNCRVERAREGVWGRFDREVVTENENYNMSDAATAVLANQFKGDTHFHERNKDGSTSYVNGQTFNWAIRTELGFMEKSELLEMLRKIHTAEDDVAVTYTDPSHSEVIVSLPAIEATQQDTDNPLPSKVRGYQKQEV